MIKRTSNKEVETLNAEVLKEAYVLKYYIFGIKIYEDITYFQNTIEKTKTGFGK